MRNVDVTPLIVVACYSVAELVLIRIGMSDLGECPNDSEDCIPPEGDITGIGASLPEFELLGYPENKQAYYIRCQECDERFNRPKDDWEKQWVKEWTHELKMREREWYGEEDGKSVKSEDSVKSEEMSVESGDTSRVTEMSSIFTSDNSMSTVATEYGDTSFQLPNYLKAPVNEERQIEGYTPIMREALFKKAMPIQAKRDVIEID